MGPSPRSKRANGFQHVLGMALDPDLAPNPGDAPVTVDQERRAAIQRVAGHRPRQVADERARHPRVPDDRDCLRRHLAGTQLTQRSLGGDAADLLRRLQVREGAKHSANTVRCDALLVDTISRSDTYPYIDIREDDVQLGHEATVSRVSEEQLFYLMSRGMPEDEAMAMIVRGFIEPIARELPMEYALELNRLIELQMEGSVG